MEQKENNQHSSLNNSYREGSLEQPQVPSSLLPTVLQRLGLGSDQPQDKTTPDGLDALLAQLKSEHWEVRAAAVRMLGKQEANIPLEVLLSALDDRDEAVRAAAVQALGNKKQVPIQRLIAALSDANWHVRETAVFALSKQGQQVPREVLVTALQDNDVSVREVAWLVLQQHPAEDGRIASYGKLWEHKIMNNTSETNGKSAYIPQTISDYSQSSARVHTIGEQIQEYTPQIQEYQNTAAEPATVMPSHWEKATSYPQRRKEKRWWIIVPIVAILFFMLGTSVNSLVPWKQATFFSSVANKAERAQPVPPFLSSQFIPIATSQIASALNLTPAAIREQLMNGTSIIQIANAQGISAPQFHDIALKAMSDLINAEAKAGVINQDQQKSQLQQIQQNPEYLNKMVSSLFLDNTPAVIPPQ